MLPNASISANLSSQHGSEATSDGMVWCFATIQDRLVEAWGFQRRMPGGGRAPFAADGPWHLVIRERADVAEAMLAGHVDALPRLPLRAREVDRMNEALGWIVHVRRPDDVKLLAVAIDLLERSGHRIGWGEVAARVRLRNKLGHLLGPDALRMRYRRAIDDMVMGVNGAIPTL